MSASSGNSNSSSVKNAIPILILLAILGSIVWNFPNLYWYEIAWFCLSLGMFVIRLPFEIQNRQNKITVSRNNWLEKTLLVGMFLSMGILPFLYLATKGTTVEFLTAMNYSLPDFATWLGVLLVPPMLFVFWRSHADLGRNWSAKLEIHSEQKLVTNGVYSRVRHPMYLAIWLAAVAQALLIHNWLAGFLVVPIFLAMYVSRIQREEAMMQTQFGSDYDAYMEKTGRILPKFL
ncbi:MAG: protein-S-isoprenylcysteine O-methyltransferase [Pseudomonadota bacterium]